MKVVGGAVEWEEEEFRLRWISIDEVSERNPFFGHAALRGAARRGVVAELLVSICKLTGPRLGELP